MQTINEFSELGLPNAILLALSDLGYERPTPIQQQSIPIMMQSHNLIAQAKTGTGKTAAFVLPILSHINLKLEAPQALILAPTRELAIQVADAFKGYAKHLDGFRVAPIYGGQDYRTQLKALKRGPHVIVGTPGRLLDHFRRGSLKTNYVSTVILDEADEMLKMGFIEDIETILEQVAQREQTALFSATIPPSIQQIAKRYIKDAKKIIIKHKQDGIDTIEQSYIRVSRDHKFDVLTRYLETEETQATIVFTKTRSDSIEIADKLQARGYATAALNGDLKQSHREKVISQIKKGGIDIIVATDVAARGIDVDRISHVVNYDSPYDTESYIHRIGRTGRAGRHGKALLFITPREQRILRDIERMIRKPIQEYQLPSIKKITARRAEQMAERVAELLQDDKKLLSHRKMIDSMIKITEADARDVAAALSFIAQESNPLPKQDIKSAPETRKKSDDWKKKGSRNKTDRRKKFASESGDKSKSFKKRKTLTLPKPKAKRKFKAKSKSH